MQRLAISRSATQEAERWLASNYVSKIAKDNGNHFQGDNHPCHQ